MKKILTERLATSVDLELREAVAAVAVSEDRSEGAIVRAALRAYKPVQARLAAKESK